MSNGKPVIILENPTIEEANGFIKSVLLERKVVILVGNCWVDYQGRASSRLEAGERIIIIKEDGSILVHRPWGYEPINWQPTGCMIQTRTEGEILRVRATRRKPSESVTIFFDKIYG